MGKGCTVVRTANGDTYLEMNAYHVEQERLLDRDLKQHR